MLESLVLPSLSPPQYLPFLPPASGKGPGWGPSAFLDIVHMMALSSLYNLIISYISDSYQLIICETSSSVEISPSRPVIPSTHLHILWNAIGRGVY
jgi:hypothetical protein